MKGTLRTTSGDLPIEVAFAPHDEGDGHVVAITLTVEFEVRPGWVFTDQQIWLFGREEAETILRDGAGVLTDEHGKEYLFFLEGSRHE